MLSHGAKKFRHLGMAVCAKFESPNAIIGHASLMKRKHTFSIPAPYGFHTSVCISFEILLAGPAFDTYNRTKSASIQAGFYESFVFFASVLNGFYLRSKFYLGITESTNFSRVDCFSCADCFIIFLLLDLAKFSFLSFYIFMLNFLKFLNNIC